MPDEPKFKTKNLLNTPSKRYGRKSWIGLGVVLALGAVSLFVNSRQEYSAQTLAYESAQRNAAYAETVDDPGRSIKTWQTAIASLEEVDTNHSKYDEAQELIAEYEEKVRGLRGELRVIKDEERSEARAEAQESVTNYNALLATLDPGGVAVSHVALDPSMDNQIIVTVGSGWGATDKTGQLDLAETLWKAWGQVCGCDSPRIKFKSQAGRDLGGTGVFGTAIELKD